MHLIWGNPSDAWHNAQIIVIICIKMILHWNLFAFLTACSPCLVKQTKAILAFGWFEWTGEKKKEIVDAFIKYGNLLNGLWQSHWRSLFRCRWLPPWLPLSLVELPVREKRREESSLLFLLTDSQSLWLSVYIWDWLTALLLNTTLPLNRLWLSLFPPFSV